MKRSKCVLCHEHREVFAAYNPNMRCMIFIGMHLTGSERPVCVRCFEEMLNLNNGVRG